MSDIYHDVSVTHNNHAFLLVTTLSLSKVHYAWILSLKKSAFPGSNVLLKRLCPNHFTRYALTKYAMNSFLDAN